MISFIKPQTDLGSLVRDYSICARSEGKSPQTIDLVARCVYFFESFLQSEGYSTSVQQIGPSEIRAYIVHLQQRKRFLEHPFTKAQERTLSQHSVNCYLRSIRAFWSWLVQEEIIENNPFARVKLPKTPRKVVPTFSGEQIKELLSVIDTSTAEGFRDYTMVLTFIDTGLRLSELMGLRMGDLWLDEGIFKVFGKGGKERLIPIGRNMQRVLLRYINHFRPEPALPKEDFVFLTRYGTQITKSRVEDRIKKYGMKAGITGVRCSPHTMRHTAAVSFLRNGGDVFSLQRLLGHSTLEMTRHYCEIADADMKKAHTIASPVDNLHLAKGRR